ncbi:hypothetical protein GYA19_02565 [Candidatus Beckwithbacteria bacterium]|nr:hypothetical protein [Candidatus Beckwithbacteria bacterium]
MFKLPKKNKRSLQQNDKPQLILTNLFSRIHKRFVLLVGCIFIITLILYLVFFSQLLTIKTIDCRFENENCNPHIKSYCQDLYGQNLITFSSIGFEDKIFNNYPEIGEVFFKKNFPDKLEIHFIKRKAILSLENSLGQKFLVDEHNLIFAEGNRDDLINIKINESFAIGEQISNPTVLDVLKLIDILEESYIPIKNINIKSKDNIEVFLLSGDQALFTAEKDLFKQADAWQFILNNKEQLKDDKEEEQVDYQLVDLRFDNPIIK